MIKITDKPEITKVYSKNNCMKCMLVKNQLTDAGVPFEEINIEMSGQFDEYVEHLKEKLSETLSMPIVVPAQYLGLSPWWDFDADALEELLEKF